MNAHRAANRTALGTAHLVVVGAALCAAVIIVFVLLRGEDSGPAKVTQNPTTAPVVTRPATAPVTRPSTKPAEPKVARSYMDVLLANHPALPTTRPLALPLGVTQAAHLIVKEPIYLSDHREMWITRADAPPTEEVLKQVGESSEHVVRERVLYVHWLPDADNAWWPTLITPAAEGAGFEIVSIAGRRAIGSGRDYRWDRARSWNERLVVPTSTGVSVFRFGPEPVETYQDLAGLGAAGAKDGAASTFPATSPATGPAVASRFAEPQTMLDWQGMLAWIPWEEGKVGSRGAARFVGEKWKLLSEETGWPDKVLHLIPLESGSVMQIIAGDEEEEGPEAGRNGGKPSVGQRVRLGVTDLDHAGVDRAKVAKLIAKLSDDDEAIRDAAFNELSRFGPAISPLLKEMVDEQPPEAVARMRQLMRNQVQPLLGSMVLIGNRLKLISRHRDGGLVLYADAGVSVADAEGGEPVSRVPAWLAIRPGQPQPALLLSGKLVEDLLPGKAQVLASGDEWVVVSDVRGPRQFFGNDFVQLLRKDEEAFSQWIGKDRRSRWLFRRPGATEGETLIIDPTLPDQTPRLPVWNYVNAKVAGWDKDNWPAIDHIGTARLKEEGWVAFEKDEVLLTQRDQIPATNPTTAPTTGPVTQPATEPTTTPTTRPATTQVASTQPSTTPVAAGPSTQPADDGLGPALLVTPDGTRYFDGVTELRAVTKDGLQTAWPLPAIASGKAPAHLVRTADGRLYLFNQPGRVLRIKSMPDAREPFAIEATFTRNIPAVEDPTRIWLDPAGRIVMCYENKLAIMFPSGFIPPVIRQRMIDPDEAEGEGK